METLLQKSAILYRRPWLVVVIVGLITGFFALGLPRLTFDNSIRSMLPADNHDLRINDYYENENRFGKSSVVYVGIESADAFAPEQLVYVRQLENAIKALNQRLPAENLAKFAGLSAQDAQLVVDAARSRGINDESFQTELAPILLSAQRGHDEFGWDLEQAKRISLALAKRPLDRLYMMLENPIHTTQSVVTADEIVNQDDALVTQAMIPADQEITPEIAKGLQAKLETWEVYKNTLYASDGTMSAIVVKLNNVDSLVMSDVADEMQALFAQGQPANTKVWLDGEGVIASAMGSTMRSDLRVLMPLVIVMVILVLFFCFRNLPGVLYPMIVVVISVICSLGAMAWLGVPISIAAVSLPPLMVAIACAYGIHQINHYQLEPGHDKAAILHRNMGVVGLAIVLSGITVMVGFGALIAENFVPIRNFGLFTAFGDLVAVAVALWVLPALLMLGGKTKTKVHQAGSRDIVNALLRGFVSLNRKASKLVLVVAIVATLVFSVGFAWIKSELNNVSFFKNDAPVRMADDKLNQKMAGTQTVNIVLDSDPSPLVLNAEGELVAEHPAAEPKSIVTPEVLRSIDGFSQAVVKKFPYATKVLSFGDIAKKMNQEMNGGSPADYRIPDSAELLSQYLLIFSGDIQSAISANHDKLRVAVTLKRVGTEESEQVANFARQWFSPEFCAANNLHVEVTGAAHLYYVANNLLMDGMIKSIIICVLLVFLLLLLVLRDLRMTLISLIPIGITLIINFGLLGLLGIPLNTATAMVSSVAVGIGVDYSIHFITWYRMELTQQPDIYSALEASILHKGRAIVFNMLVIVAGFIVLVASNFVPLMQFGLLVSLCMLTTAFGALAIVPAVIRVLAKKNRRFLLLGQPIALSNPSQVVSPAIPKSI